MAINTVDQAVISQGLIAAAREMGVKLVRSAYSPVVREANDCSAALLDRFGNVVAQAELIPMQITCTRKDRPVYEALIELLMDPDGKIRWMAFNALMARGGTDPRRKRGSADHPDFPGGFGYNPRAKEESRAPAIERFREWLESQ